MSTGIRVGVAGAFGAIPSNCRFGERCPVRDRGPIPAISGGIKMGWVGSACAAATLFCSAIAFRGRQSRRRRRTSADCVLRASSSGGGLASVDEIQVAHTIETGLRRRFDQQRIDLQNAGGWRSRAILSSLSMT